MSGDVTITLVESGSSNVLVPQASIQVVMGCSSAGTAGQMISTRSPSALVSTFGYGPLVEAASLACLAGGTVIAVKLAQNAAGTASAVTGTFGATVPTVMTVTVDGTVGAFDDYYVVWKCVGAAASPGGTKIGVAGITFQVSLDAGRTFGPVIALGTASTYVIPQTGITLHFQTGSNEAVVVGDVATFGTVAPAWNDAGVATALTNLGNSVYAINGWGSGIHLVGKSAGADATAIELNLDTQAANYVFTGLMMSARDVSPAAKWGGTGETEATWITALQTDFSGVSAKRILAGAGYYNMPSAIANPAAGAPRYRRPLTWANAARQIAIPAQRHSGRVKDGALANVILDASNDPLDGFVYHDERQTGGLDSARFLSAQTRVGLPGYYVKQPKLMSPSGSDFDIWPLRSVMDIACAIVHQVGQLQINDDLRTMPSTGALYEPDARVLERDFLNAINEQMTSLSMISGATVAVDRTNNVRSTKAVNVAIQIASRGYVLSESITIGYQSANAAQ